MLMFTMIVQIQVLSFAAHVEVQDLKKKVLEWTRTQKERLSFSTGVEYQGASSFFVLFYSAATTLS